jgi:hypothetical protein
VQSVRLASLSVAVATIPLLHNALTKSSICGKEFNKNKSCFALGHENRAAEPISNAYATPGF